MICKKCGADNPIGSFVCNKCGTPLGINEDAPVQNTPASVSAGGDDNVTCPNCQASVKAGIKFCPSCGMKMTPKEKKPENTAQNDAPAEKTCAKCGKTIKATVKFCPFCGQNPDAPTEQPAPSIDQPAPSLDKPAPSPEQTATPSLDSPAPVIWQSAPAAEGIVCSCGNILNPGAKFCPKCGNKVGDAAPKADAPSSEQSAPAADQPAPAAEGIVCSCGNVLNPGAKFCPKCGNKVGDAPAAVSSLDDTAAVPAIPNSAAPNFTQAAPAAAVGTAVKKPVNKKTVAIIGAVSAVVIIGIIIAIVIANLPPKINLNDYIKIEYDGYNGYGRIDTSFDTDKFRADWEGKLKFTGDISTMGTYLDSYTNPVDVVLYNVKYSYSVDKYSNLSNGDVVHLKWDLGLTKEYIQNYIKVDINDSEMEINISDLKEITSFDPFDSFTIKYTGYNGNGKPDYTSKYSLSYIFDKTEGLKNGDTIHVSVEAPYGDDLAKYCANNIGSVPSTTSKDFTVEGLSDMGTFDPFENIDVKFDGVSPAGTAEIENNSSTNLRYSLDKDRDLKEGDKVTVTVTAPYGYDLEEYCRDNYEKKPSASTKVYTVANLPSYVTKPDEISEDALKKMKEETEDTIQSGITAEGETLDKLEYQGMLILNLKDGKDSRSSWSSSGDFDHMTYIVYKVTVKVKNHDDKISSFTYWTYCKFNNITVFKDGKCEVNTEEVAQPNDSVSPSDASYYYKGYEKYETMFAKVVTAKLSDYKYESSMNTGNSESSEQTSQVSSQTSETSAQTSQTSGQTSETSAQQSSQASTQTSGTSSADQSSQASAQTSETSTEQSSQASEQHSAAA